MQRNHSAEWLRGYRDGLEESLQDGVMTDPVHGDPSDGESWRVPSVEIRRRIERAQTLLAAAEAREAVQLTAAEVIEELHGCFDTIKHLSADIGTESGDIAVNGVALLGLAKIARWKEANHAK